jgi:cell division protein FtsQ
MSIGRVKKHRHGINISWRLILKAVILTGFIVCFSFFVMQFKNIESFPIHHVKIFGAQHVDHESVQKLIFPLVSRSFFGIDVDKIKERILQLPWVAQVVVRRTWPDLVVVSINEKKPVALWNNNSLLSSAGELFTPQMGTYPTNLPQLMGPAGEQIMMSQYYDKINGILSPLHSKITRLELTPSMAWSLTLDNGMKLTIGHKDILTRLNHFVKVYSKIVGDRVFDVEYIDLRYPNGMAVKWKSVT